MVLVSVGLVLLTPSVLEPHREHWWLYEPHKGPTSERVPGSPEIRRGFGAMRKNKYKGVRATQPHDPKTLNLSLSYPILKLFKPVNPLQYALPDPARVQDLVELARMP